MLDLIPLSTQWQSPLWALRFGMRNPHPNCAYHELQEPTQPLLKGQIIPAGTLSRWSNLRLQQLGLGNVTEAWRIMKTWKYLPREGMSLNAPVKEIADRFQLTSTHPQGQQDPGWQTHHTGEQWLLHPSKLWLHPWGQSIHRRRTSPRPCKLPHFLQKYPSSNPQIRNIPHRKEPPALALRLPPRCHQERGTRERNQGTFPSREQKAAAFPEQCSGLVGVVSPLNGVKSAQGECVLPKVITEVRPLLTQSPFLTLGMISTEPSALPTSVAMDGAGTWAKHMDFSYMYGFWLALLPKTWVWKHTWLHIKVEGEQGYKSQCSIYEIYVASMLHLKYLLCRFN